MMKQSVILDVVLNAKMLDTGCHKTTLH